LPAVPLLRRPVRHLQHGDADGGGGGPLPGDPRAAGLPRPAVPAGRPWASWPPPGSTRAGWSLPPFFGWSAYVPEGLMTSCSWDYMTFHALRALLHHAVLHLRLLHPSVHHRLQSLLHLQGHPPRTRHIKDQL
ncbi:unnamed protein product, partial [Tetraodon nigroviridis]